MKINAILLGKLIKAARVTENMSSADFAKKAGISPSALTRLENPPKVDFRVSYDNLLNALELVGTFNCVRSKVLRFDEYLREAYAKETINLFLSFAKWEDYDFLDAYLYEKTAPKSESVNRHMVDMQDTLQDVLHNHFKAKEFQAVLTNASESFLEHHLSEYKDDPEAYDFMKTDYPTRTYNVTEALAQVDTEMHKFNLRNDIDNAFGELLSNPSVENAVMLALEIIKEVG